MVVYKGSTEPLVDNTHTMKSKFKKVSEEIGQNLVDNLNRNVMLDHIEYVERGIREPDDDYYRALEMKKRGEI